MARFRTLIEHYFNFINLKNMGFTLTIRRLFLSLKYKYVLMFYLCSQKKRFVKSFEILGQSTFSINHLCAGSHTAELELTMFMYICHCGKSGI